MCRLGVGGRELIQAAAGGEAGGPAPEVWTRAVVVTGDLRGGLGPCWGGMRGPADVMGLGRRGCEEK